MPSVVAPPSLRWPAWIDPADPELRPQTKPVRMLTHAGETKPLAAWARAVKLSPAALRLRIDLSGWTVAEAVTTPRGGRPARLAVRRALSRSGRRKPTATDRHRRHRAWYHPPKLERSVRGLALVRWQDRGRRRALYLGRFGTPEADARYAAFVVEWKAGRVVAVNAGSERAAWKV